MKNILQNKKALEKKIDWQSIKKELLENYKSLSNPATYVIESALPFPIKESFLPPTGAKNKAKKKVIYLF